MDPNTVGIRELKSRLASYVRRVKAGSTLVITERGKPVGRIVPVGQSVEERTYELARAGLVAWSGRKLRNAKPIAKTHGKPTVAQALLDDRE